MIYKLYFCKVLNKNCMNYIFENYIFSKIFNVMKLNNFTNNGKSII